MVVSWCPVVISVYGSVCGVRNLDVLKMHYKYLVCKSSHGGIYIVFSPS